MKTDKILSQAAKDIISKATEAGRYSDIMKKDPLEPPYMAPSLDPEAYPDVCIVSHSRCMMPLIRDQVLFNL